MATQLKSVRSVRDQVSPEEWQIRVDLACAYRLAAHFGWDDLVFTHLSARVPGAEHHFLLNPLDLMFDEITASSLVKVDMGGRPVMATPYRLNPGGFLIHSAIHMGRDDAQSVMHLHTPHGQAVSAMKAGLMPITQTAMFVTSSLAYHDFEGVALDADEKARLIADIGDKQTMILRNHGTLATGPSVGETFIRLYYLERACEAQVLALAAGRDGINEPNAGIPEKVTRQSSPKGSAPAMMREVVWPALVRKMDRLDRSYRT